MKTTNRIFPFSAGRHLLLVAGCVFVMGFALTAGAPQTAAPWIPDLGNGSYRNPVLYADYSDPDAVRVGRDFYLIASSFTCVPGLPVLRSRDLVNWRLVNHALPVQMPAEHYAEPRHGGGVWAPSIRYRAGRYWIYYPDPDFGIYLVTARDPSGAWSAPVLVKPGKGLIDPCPLWDDDGALYLVHAWARSRSGKNNLLTLNRLSPDGARVTDGDGVVIIDENSAGRGWTTLEGPKLYKLRGYYWVFAPAGGVTGGYQAAYRAKKITGPYESRIVLAQGSTRVNGPHQGALIDTPSGAWWFLHFQDQGAYGRVVHLQPVTWRDDWPVIGADPEGDGTGEPVLTHRKPDAGRGIPIAVPETSDEFGRPRMGMQWQWQANPQASWASLSARAGMLRMISQPAAAPESLWMQANLLLQKFPAPEFVITTALDFAPQARGEKAGLIVFGDSYAWIGLVQTESGLRISQVVCKDARNGGAEKEAAGAILRRSAVQLRLEVSAGAKCSFSYSEDGRAFVPLGGVFTAVAGRWVGAKAGLFSVTPDLHAVSGTKTGHADFDWFRVSARQQIVTMSDYP